MNKTQILIILSSGGMFYLGPCELCIHSLGFTKDGKFCDWIRISRRIIFTELEGSTAREVNIKQNRSADMNGENGNIWKEVVMDYST